MPMPCAATPSRALFIRSSIARKPWPLVPSRQPCAFSNTTSQVGEPWMPSFFSSRATRMPLRLPSSRWRGTRISDSPLVVPLLCS